MKPWKYTSADKLVVSRQLEGGGTESCEASVIADWIAEGNTPEPADIPTLAQLTADALTQVRTLRAAFFPILAGLQSEANARDKKADAMAIADLQQAMRDITATDLTGATTKADVEAKFKTAWLTALSTAPASVVAAFRGLNK